MGISETNMQSCKKKGSGEKLLESAGGVIKRGCMYGARKAGRELI